MNTGPQESPAVKLAKLKEESKKMPELQTPEEVQKKKEQLETDLKKVVEQLKTVDTSELQSKMKFMDLDVFKKQIEERRKAVRCLAKVDCNWSKLSYCATPLLLISTQPVEVSLSTPSLSWASFSIQLRSLMGLAVNLFTFYHSPCVASHISLAVCGPCAHEVCYVF